MLRKPKAAGETEDGYGKTLFSRDRFALMADPLARLKGRFILSIYDVPQIRELFCGFKFREVGLTYSVSGRGTEAKVLIIAGKV